MSDLKKYIQKRKTHDKAFAEGYDEGYMEFRIGEDLKQARLEAGITQEELAQKLNKKNPPSPASKTMRRTSNFLRCRI